MNKAATTSLVLLAMIASIGVLYLLKGILLPFVIAIMVSYLLSPLVEKMHSYKVPRIATLLLIILLLSGFLFRNLELLLNNALAFAQDFPSYQSQFLDLLQNYTAEYEWLEVGLSQVTDWFFSLPIASYTNSLVNSSVSILSNVFLILLFVIYLCLTIPNLPKKVERAFPTTKAKRLEKVLNHINQDIRKYVSLHTAVSLATGVSVGIVCWAMSVPFWFLWGTLAFFLNYIPTIGSILATIPPLVTTAVVLGITPALWVGILVILAQLFWGNIVEPKIAGDSLGLSPLVILLSLVFWGWLWGIVGAILAVPIAVIIKVTCLNIPALQSIGVFMDDL